ncbi:hypothetical protein QQX98_013126 [Neonectria punicea]|uniref:Uncharacterized protein n=1 Tax=Neonectria punicea TaxID=979145 RepID=A0ABR1GGY0_9HYPO
MMSQEPDQAAQRPQPSFPAMADHLQGLSVQMGLCANLPAVDGGSAILQAVNTLTTKVDILAAKVDTLTTKVDNLGKQLGHSLSPRILP